MRNERGIALIAVLVLLPLLLAAVALVAGAQIAMGAHREALHACRTAMLQTQDELALGLRRLRALNPQADRLRGEAREAERQMAAAPLPYLKALWAARRAQILAQQAALDLRQRAAIAMAEARARAAFERGRREAPASYARVARRFQGRNARGGGFASGSAPAMRLLRAPPLELAPRYEAAPDAAFSQVARLSWRARLGELLPSWMKISKDSERAETLGQCASTVDAKEGLWRSRLAADKL